MRSGASLVTKLSRSRSTLTRC